MGNNKKFKTYVFQGLLFCLIVVFCMGCTKKQNDYAGSYYGDNLEYTIGESLATVKGGKWETQNGFVRFVIPASELSWRLSVYEAKTNEKIVNIFQGCALGSMLSGQSSMECLDNTLRQVLAEIGSDAKIKYNPKNAGKIRELLFASYPELKSGLSSSNEQERVTVILFYGIISTSAVIAAKMLNDVGELNSKPFILQFEDEKDNRFSIKNSRGTRFDEFVSEAFLGTEAKDYYLPLYEVAVKINAMK